MSKERASDEVPRVAADWLRDILADPRKRIAIRRASTLDEFKQSWYVAALLGRLRIPPTDQVLVSLWGAAAAKEVCEGSLAEVARANGIKERHWQKLTSTRLREEAARQTRRLLRQLPAAPIEDVITKLFYWGDNARRQWAMEWFNVTEEAEE